MTPWILVVATASLLGVQAGRADAPQRRAEVPKAALDLFFWNEAIRRWPDEPPDASRELAAGVLLQCAAQSAPRSSFFASPDSRLANSSCRGGLRANQCAQEAERQFKDALRRAPGLHEARVRLAWLRHARGASDARRDLATIAADSRIPFDLRQLALLILARHDMDEARSQEAAIRLSEADKLAPGAVSVALTLRTLTGRMGRPLPAETGDADIWYAAPCRVMTAPVRQELESRIRLARQGLR